MEIYVPLRGEGTKTHHGYLVMGAYETSAHHSPAFRAVPGLPGLYMRDPNHRAVA